MKIRPDADLTNADWPKRTADVHASHDGRVAKEFHRSTVHPDPREFEQKGDERRG